MSSEEAASQEMDRLALRPFPKTTYPDHLSRSERVKIIIQNLEQAQKDVKTELIIQALIEKNKLDDPDHPDNALRKPITAPRIKMMRAKYRPRLPKPPDARTVKNEGSLFLSQEEDRLDHALVTKETLGALDEHAKNSQASLGKFYAAGEMIAREEGRGVGSGGAGSPTILALRTAGSSVPAGSGDASRDPRLRR